MSDLSAESAAVESASGSEKPLTDEERALLQRLLSDPFSIPQQFKTWLVAYLEGSDMLLARSSVQGLNDLLGSGGGAGAMGLLPAGCIFPYGGVSEPTGAKLCNGQAISRATYKRLWDVIGTIYGAGDGSTTFNVPDLRRRLPFGAGQGVGPGGSDGIAAETSRYIDHHHGFGQTSNGGGGHDHGVSVSVSGSTGGVGDHNHLARDDGTPSVTQGSSPTAASGTVRNSTQNERYYTGNAGAHSHSFSGSGSGGTDWEGDHTHWVSGDTSGGWAQDHPAFLVVGFIINY